MSRQSLLEEISKQISDPNEKITLHELIESSTIMPTSALQEAADKKKSIARSQSFTLANVTSAAQSATKYFG
jgi:hypothetical protein